MNKRANFTSSRFLKRRICKITKWEERNAFQVFIYLDKTIGKIL